MAKKKPTRRPEAAPRQPAPAAPEPPLQPGPSFAERGFRELAAHPVLVAASVSLAITLFAAGAAIKFHDDLGMGAIREPTGMIVWAAITVTLFLRYWRERMHPPKSDS
jgi:hypothetical protein